LECVERALADTGGRLGRLWVAGHPGKLAKVLADVWDTHSHRSVNAVGPVCDVAAECGVAPGLLERARSSNTVEGVAEVLENDPNAALFWREVEARIARRVMARLTRVDSVAVKLFQMNGRALGEAA
jgi:cobalt-precorrin-5B (C1)-methyltransferase